MDGEDFSNVILIALTGLLVLMLFIGLPCAIIDVTWIQPRADDNANIICQEQGYDFFETYSREGLMSETPIAVKCKYAEQSRKIDLNVNKGE